MHPTPLFSLTCVAYCVVAEIDLLQQRPRPTYTRRPFTLLLQGV